MSAPRACATGEEEAGSGALQGPVGLGARKGAGCLGGECAGLRLEGDVTARGKAAGGLAKRPRGGLWRMGGGRSGGGWALEKLGGGVGELPCSSGLGLSGIFPLGWRATTPEGWGGGAVPSEAPSEPTYARCTKRWHAVGVRRPLEPPGL